MALVEPLIGHLLSKYKETVLEGLAKIRSGVQAGDEQGNALALALTQQEEALQAIRSTLLKTEYFAPTAQTLTVILTHLAERGSRVALIRELLRPDSAAIFRKTLSTLSDTALTHVTAALQFLTAAVKDAPLLVLARLRSPTDAHTASAAATPQRRADVPLHLAAFRLQLTYNQRRIRLARLSFLVQLITSPMHNAVAETVCSHGVLTHLLEDAAELLREGTSAGVTCAMKALRVVRERFVQSRDVSAEQKRRVLLGQRNVFRLLVRALEFEPVADTAAAILYAIVDETIESPADYASTRVESLEDHGMPNYLLFFLLRQLRPKANERMAQLVLHILQRAPDLIRPYFIRISGHLAEDGSAPGVAPTTARVAVVNVMTRTFLCPMPYHLSAQQVRLEPIAAKTSTFYAMCPRDVADEICPAWVGEYVHRLINGSTNLLMLALAMQLTQAALMRAQRVLPLIQAAQRTAGQCEQAANAERAEASQSPARGAPGHDSFSLLDLAVLRGSDDAEAEVWDTYNAQVRHNLQAALPSREEFWHRMTQQLHHSLTATAGSAAATNAAIVAKVHVVMQRMLLLMKSYVDVFDVRVPWLSAVPTFLPDLKRSAAADHGSLAPLAEAKPIAGSHPITVALQRHNDILRPWPATTVALLCELLVASQQRRVPMVKLHHINMSQSQGIGEWPLLLSVLLWVTHQQGQPDNVVSNGAGTMVSATSQEARAMGWAAQLLLWTVHSVTIHSTCTLAEAYLWLTSLTPNTVPAFLHVLNHLLMRSLSKAADRVTHELREAQHGVLVAAAQHFIDRAKEKQTQQKSTADTAAAASTAARGGCVKATPKRSQNYQNKREEARENSVLNLWGTHLQASLSEFEAVVARVVSKWPSRDALLAQAGAQVEESRVAVCRVTRQQCLEVLVLADRQRGFAKTSQHSGTSPAQQLRSFALTLRSPVLPLPEDEAEMALLGALQNHTAEPKAASTASVDEVRRIQQALGFPPTKEVPNEEEDGSTDAPRWYAMSSVCWQVAGHLLSHAQRSAAADMSGKNEGIKPTAQLAADLLRAILAKKADVASLLTAPTAREGVSTGLLVLLLACVHILLTYNAGANEKVGVAASAAEAALTQEEGEALGALCLSGYTGTLSESDRLCYAVCLTLHYLTGKGNDKAGAEEADAPRRFSGCEVPDVVVRHRFLLHGHTASTLRTAEVEMLSWHLDTLTEDDLIQMALASSARLHNSIDCHALSSTASAARHTAAEEMLCTVFPELSSSQDVPVVDVDQLVAGNVLDMRYLVPLVQRVASLPSGFLAHLSTGRVIPILLKALACVDAMLRAVAASALTTLYIPKGSLRIVVSVARLRLHQLAASATPQASKTDGNPAHTDVMVPRLPTPFAIFLITSIRPLGRYADPLHHHLIHFLIHTEHALATAVPFVRWLTTPPLTAISVPLMLETQEEAAQQQRGGSRAPSDGNTAQASAADMAQELRRGIPPQLAFVQRLLRYGCDTADDGAALLESDCLRGLLLLCGLLTASDTQRVDYVRTMLTVCTRSAAVTQLFATDGHFLVWAFSFLSELCREYGTSAPYPYSGHTFTAALQLLRVLCAGALQTAAATAAGTEATAASARAPSAASIQQLRESVSQLRARVVAAHVTARDILNAFDDVIRQCDAAATAVAQKEKREMMDSEMPEMPNLSASTSSCAKRSREKSADAAEATAFVKREKTEALA